MGDLGNIVADEDGVVNVSITDSVISLSGEKSIIGRSLVVSDIFPLLIGKFFFHCFTCNIAVLRFTILSPS